MVVGEMRAGEAHNQAAESVHQQRGPEALNSYGPTGKYLGGVADEAAEGAEG